MSSREVIRAALIEAARSMGAPEPVEPLLERPREAAHGDWSTNLAMTLAKPLRRRPREIADELVQRLRLVGDGIARIEVAGPGFINFHLAAGANARGLADIVRAAETYGRFDTGAARAVNVEFVSANPTGPLHVGHGRQAALGDAIASLLEWTGWTVDREFYYNDAGAQIANLSASVLARIRELAGERAEIPAGGYHGEYIREIAEAYVREHGGDARALLERAGLAGATDSNERASALGDAVREFAVRALRAEQDLDLKAFGVAFDTYYLESSLYEPGSGARAALPGAEEQESAVDATVRRLVAAGHTYELDGALWLRTTDFGDDKDRVMRKRDGSYTYFLPDVAYHVTKWERGFRRAVNVQGADHHSTVTRVRAGLQALDMSIPEGYPEYVLHQLVTVMRAGDEVKISKRAGSYVTVRDLIDEVGRDAVRYFFLMRKADSPLVFDIELAKSQSDENPVYYIQMAHARMSGIFRVGEIDPASVSAEGVDFGLLAEPEERALIKALLDFPDTVAGAAAALEPQRLASYLLETARLVHLWYHTHHVLNEPEPITRARLLLALASRIVVRNGLQLLGISAPDRM